MQTSQNDTFGSLLRRHRRTADLSQQTLAERAGVSTDTISNLERGVPHLPREDTLQLLVEGLALTAEDEALFRAAARQLRAVPIPPNADARRGASSPGSGSRLRVPLAPTPLVGREGELAALHQLLTRDTVRLLTLVGTGGVGKTRLAQELGQMLQDEFDDGACFVSLARVRDADSVAAAILEAFELREAGTRSPDEMLRMHLRDKRLLLVLDNFEHVIQAAPLVANLLGACPQVKVLATSRAGLHLRGEQEYGVAPLALPPETGVAQPANLAQVASVDLFLQRVRAVRPDFTLTAANVQAIAAICRKLDGLPLAIELAAVRTRLLSPEDLLEHLDPRLSLLTDGPRDLPARQRTLRATIVWSYDLLPHDAQTVFRRMAVFAGGCTLEAIAAVHAATKVDALQADGVIDALSALLDHHLIEDVAQKQAGSRGRYRFVMLQTVREYAWEELRAHHEANLAERAHAAFFLDLAEEAAPQLTGVEQEQWVWQVEQAHDDLLAALRWSQQQQQGIFALRLTGALWRFWEMSGRLSLGRAYLERALAASLAQDEILEPPQRYNQALKSANDGVASLRANVLHGIGVLALRQADYEAAQSFTQEALALRRAISDTRGVAHSLNNLGEVARERGAYQQALALYKESLHLKRALKDEVGIIHTLGNIGLTYFELGEHERAEAALNQSLRQARAFGHTGAAARALANLADVLQQTGRAREAQPLAEESMLLRHTLNDRVGTAHACAVLASVVEAQGDDAQALRLYREALATFDEVGTRADVAQALVAIGLSYLNQRRCVESLRLLSAAWEDYQTFLAPKQVSRRQGLDTPLSSLRAVLGEERFAQLWAEGQAMTIDQAVAFALE